METKELWEAEDASNLFSIVGSNIGRAFCCLSSEAIQLAAPAAAPGVTFKIRVDEETSAVLARLLCSSISLAFIARASAWYRQYVPNPASEPYATARGSENPNQAGGNISGSFRDSLVFFLQ